VTPEDDKHLASVLRKLIATWDTEFGWVSDDTLDGNPRIGMDTGADITEEEYEAVKRALDSQ
jgi:hypothetical protein